MNNIQNYDRIFIFRLTIPLIFLTLFKMFFYKNILYYKNGRKGEYHRSQGSLASKSSTAPELADFAVE